MESVIRLHAGNFTFSLSDAAVAGDSARFRGRSRPGGGKIKSILDRMEAGEDVRDEAAKLAEELPSLMPDDPAMAAVIEEAMAAEFAAVAEVKAKGEGEDEGEGEDAVKNSTDANGAEHAEAGSGNGGQFVSKGGGDGAEQDDNNKTEAPRSATDEEVERFRRDLPKRISAEDTDALLSHGFTDSDGDGNAVRYGKLLLEHLDRDAHSEKDRLARKRRLGVAVKVIRGAKATPSRDPGKPNERVYFGLSDGKAYIAVADEHSEIGALEMVSYRRDGRRDER